MSLRCKYLFSDQKDLSAFSSAYQGYLSIPIAIQLTPTTKSLFVHSHGLLLGYKGALENYIPSIDKIPYMLSFEDNDIDIDMSGNVCLAHLIIRNDIYLSDNRTEFLLDLFVEGRHKNTLFDVNGPIELGYTAKLVSFIIK